MKRLIYNFFPFSLLSLAIVLLSLSFPRLIAGMKMIYPNVVYKQLLHSKFPDNQLLMNSRAKVEDALEWNENPTYWLKIGHLLYELIYSDQYEVDEYLALNKLSDKANRSCLSLSIVEPFVWYRLADGLYIVDDQDVNILKFLQLSIYTGRIEPNLFLLRLTFLSRYIDVFDDELNGLIKDQIRLAWNMKKHHFVNTVIDTPALKPLVYDALSPEDYIDFDQRFDKISEKNNPTN